MTRASVISQEGESSFEPRRWREGARELVLPLRHSSLVIILLGMLFFLWLDTLLSE
jgi:hypothetical protein